MPLLVVRHRVKDFAAWKQVFAEHGPKRDGADFSNPRIYRSASDPNEVVILIDAASID